MDSGDPTFRLNSLYKDVLGPYLHTNEPRSARQIGISPSQQHFLKGQQLDRRKVYDTIKVLSQWRMGRRDPFVCALEISTLWI